MTSGNGARGKKGAAMSRRLQHVVCQRKRGKGTCFGYECRPVTSSNTLFEIEKRLRECNLSLCLATWRQGGEGRRRDGQSTEPKGNSVGNALLEDMGQPVWGWCCIPSLPEEFSGIKPVQLSPPVRFEPNSPAVLEGSATPVCYLLVSSRKHTADIFN